MAGDSRVWFAVLDGDTVRCEVADVPRGSDWSTNTATRQWFRVVALEMEGWTPSRDDLYGECDKRGLPCEPGRPCVKCHKAARQVWERDHGPVQTPIGPLFAAPSHDPATGGEE